jgi:hypothetical protein
MFTSLPVSRHKVMVDQSFRHSRLRSISYRKDGDAAEQKDQPLKDLEVKPYALPVD